jgi:hypothetical protein
MVRKKSFGSGRSLSQSQDFRICESGTSLVENEAEIATDPAIQVSEVAEKMMTKMEHLLQDQEEYPFLTTLYAVRIQTRRSLDRHNYTHTGELLGSPIHATIAFSFEKYQLSSLSQTWYKII